MELRGKRILVVGLARSGRAAATLLVARGARVTVTDVKREEELGEAVDGLKSLPIVFSLGSYPEVSRRAFDLVVTSPGVPPTAPPLRQAAQSGVPVWSELELAARLLKGRIIGITGTNGKTTTTSLLGHILRKAGRDVVVAGNIGIPLSGEVAQGAGRPERWWVLEVSSFQLEFTAGFRPEIAVFLNLTPDHLDWHGTLEDYAAAKRRIFANQGPGDWAVLNGDDPAVASCAAGVKSRVIWFSRSSLPGQGVGVRDGMIAYRLPGGEGVLGPAGGLRLPGSHNLENALAAAAAALSAGVAPEEVWAGLATFPGVPHRLEFVRTVNGVKYVNDSKATNPESVLRALDAFTEPIILIAGGRSKGGDFAALARKIRERARYLILLGEAAPLLARAAREAGFTAIREVADLEAAVQEAARLARPGDVVLLSPACASWDMFRDFEERGNLFRELVHRL